MEMRSGDDIEFMKSVEDEYQRQSGLTSRRYYKLFYSRVHRFPLLVLGLNPGGKSDGTDLRASDSFFESWEHDYVRFRKQKTEYKLAGLMCTLLAECLDTELVNDLRQVPVSNVVFRRSEDWCKLRNKPKAIRDSRPGLEKITKYVYPDVILLISIKAYDVFAGEFCTNLLEIEVDLRGRNRTFVSAGAQVSALRKDVKLLAVEHPSRFGVKRVLPKLIKEFEQAGLRPIEGSEWLITLKDLQGYGHVV